MSALHALQSTLERHGRDVAALVLRVGFSLFMVLNHGWPKLLKFPAKHLTFSDPLGVTPTVSMALAVFGELVCPLLILVGLLTRLASVPAAFTMFIAAVVVHKDDRLGDGEHALLYAIAFAAIFLLGPGRFSLDRVFKKRLGVLGG